MKQTLFIALLCAGSLIAVNISAEPLSITETEHVSINAEKQAKRWGLTATEWSQYQGIMAGRRGVWSPDLDPITALGVEADTTAQRDHFAALYVRTEFDRTRKELAFQLAVDRAWRRLYPDTPTLQARALPQVSNEAITRFALIVSAECPTCETALTKRLIAMIAEAKEGVDVHVVGMAENDHALRDWLAKQPELNRAFKAGEVTVNHGGAFAELTEFPVIYAKRASGQWSREL